MQLNVKLVDFLGKFLPQDSTRNVTQIEINHSISIAKLIELLKLPADKPYIVSANDNLVPASERQSYVVTESDNIKIIPPLKGG